MSKEESQIYRGLFTVVEEQITTLSTSGRDIVYSGSERRWKALSLVDRAYRYIASRKGVQPYNDFDYKGKGVSLDPGETDGIKHGKMVVTKKGYVTMTLDDGNDGERSTFTIITVTPDFFSITTQRFGNEYEEGYNEPLANSEGAYLDIANKIESLRYAKVKTIQNDNFG